MKQIHRSRVLSSGRGERQSGLAGCFRQMAVALSIGALLAGAVSAAPQSDEESKQARVEMKAQKDAEKKAKAEMKAQKAAEKKAKAKMTAQKKAEKKTKSSKTKTPNPARAQIADTPKGTYLPGQFTEEQRKAAPAADVKQF